MPRKKRTWFPGAMYHITARGNRKDLIYHEREDYHYYLHLLEKAQKRYPFKLHSYCLMPNHIHLLIETEMHSPSTIIHYIHSLYARYFNNKYKCIGHLFQNRFNDKVIKDWKQMMDTSRYIHLNPVKAGLVIKPEKYPWSSYKVFISTSENSIVTSEKIVNTMCSGSKNTYKHYVEMNLKKDNLYS
ncbi:transposase [Bacillus salacetis]|uniref:Transposase n=1 Tax=Bacillus salacetis TaxID=2315464 RepID=A0A3A1QMZ4_9BACI|nr:transposase [Bacillus salacetis]RIW28248.1 transposase [Bacillus salacetis]